MSIDVAAAKRRLVLMGVVNAAAVVSAAGAAVGYFGLHQGWALIAFAASLVAGFAAQVWFIASLRKGAA